MKNKPIIIVAGEPKSIFFEIFFKSIKKKIYKSPIILICNKENLKFHMKKLNFKKKLRIINFQEINKIKINNKLINIINVPNKNPKNLNSTKKFMTECFDIAFKLLKKKFSYKFINGPINKSKFLDKKFNGMTEYISKKFKISNSAMLIYNKSLSVCPLTTHIPIKFVTKNITRKFIIQKTILINNFFVKKIGIKPKIAVTGLNPHCESTHNFSEDNKIIKPAVKLLKKKGFKIDGPHPADTIFLKQNRKKYNIIIGMYHDQVLTPLKSLKEYDAINITLGLPFYRVSPDHGPNEKMVYKNLSNPLSLIKALDFLDNK